jgi:hypothetical protein
MTTRQKPPAGSFPRPLFNVKLRHRVTLGRRHADLTVEIVRSLTEDDLKRLTFEEALDSVVAASQISPPALGHKLACFLVPIDRQEEVLGDLDERFNARWLHTLGPTGARWCYVWNLFRLSLALARVATLGAFGAFIWRYFRGG